MLQRLILAALATVIASPAFAQADAVQPAAPASQPPDARRLLHDLVEACGGTKSLAPLRNVVLDAKQVGAMDYNATIRVVVLATGKVLLRGEEKDVGKFEQGFDGTTAWSVDGAMGPRLIEGAELYDLRRFFDQTLGLAGVDKLYPKASGAQRSTFQGKDAWRAELTTADGRVITAWFDPATHLQVGIDTKHQGLLGDVAVTVVFEDYADTSGFRFPRTWRQSDGGLEMKTTITTVTANAADVPAIAPPPEVAALLQKAHEPGKP